MTGPWRRGEGRDRQRRDRPLEEGRDRRGVEEGRDRPLEEGRDRLLEEGRDRGEGRRRKEEHEKNFPSVGGVNWKGDLVTVSWES